MIRRNYKYSDELFGYALGFIKAETCEERRVSLLRALWAACESAEGVEEATGDAEAAAQAGCYEFDLHIAAEASK